jgi:hypothetical protein
MIGLAAVLTACRLIGAGAGAGEDLATNGQDVVSVAGWTRLATTTKYMVVVNVLPGEQMFTDKEADAEHPTVGELIINGPGQPVGTNVRHVEAHIYDRATGLPVTGVMPIIVLLNRTTGARTVVPPTLMQDVNIGSSDIHFGNNVVVSGDSDLSLTVTIGDEEVTFDGHLS